MPYNDPDATDPMALHGVAVETESDAAIRDMAACFIEESMRSGFTADRILRMFRTQGYAGPFAAYQTLGENTIRRMIEDQASLRGGRFTSTTGAAGTDGSIRLVSLG